MRAAVIGAGASGMTAALTAARLGHEVRLFERQARVGRKLMATGNGRCNLTNTQAGPRNYHGEAPNFVRPALESFGPAEALDFFRGLGLLTREEYGGRVYPLSNSANSVVDVLRQAHYISPTDDQAVMLLNLEVMFAMMDNLLIGVRLLAWLVGLGTLLAGAIGVSNIMMVTVRERTTEIGIRRAIGARPRDILQQILSESMVLTTVAGMAGISFAVGILQLVENAANPSGVIEVHYQVSFGMAIGTCLLLIGMGLLAGLAPAYRAMAVKPIEAIRDE